MPPYCEEHQMYHADDPYECSNMRFKARREARQAARREKAGQIAQDALDRRCLDDAVQIVDIAQVLDVAIAAALAALTEKENAR